MPNLGILLSSAGGKGAAPAVPTLSYTAQNQFTITNYDSTLDYTLTNCTRSTDIITPTSGTATVTAKYPRALISSAARTAYTANHGIVLDSIASSPSSAGCSPRGFVGCPGGTVTDTAGNTGCAGPGTQGPFCGTDCDASSCFGNFCTCWYYHWTDYSGSGYSLIGTVWGKVT
jgi:hypothetical protein